MYSLNPSPGLTLAGPEELADHLQRQLGGRFRGLHVQVQDKGVVLTGRVPTFYAKQLAQHLVMRMTDLPILANDIEVS